MKIHVLAYTEAQISLFLRNCVWSVSGGHTHRIHRIHSIATCLGYRADICYALPRWQESFKDSTLELEHIFKRSGFEIVEVSEDQILGKAPFELVQYEFYEFYQASISKKQDRGLFVPNPANDKHRIAEARMISPIVQRGTDLFAPSSAIILELAKENKRLTDYIRDMELRANPPRMFEKEGL